MVLTQKAGANGKAKGLTASGFPTASGILRERLAAQRSYRRPAALRDLRNVPFPKSTESRDRLLWRRGLVLRSDAWGWTVFCLAPFLSAPPL